MPCLSCGAGGGEAVCSTLVLRTVWTAVLSTVDSGRVTVLMDAVSSSINPVSLPSSSFALCVCVCVCVGVPRGTVASGRMSRTALLLLSPSV